ncbi:MAG: glycosyltransferase family 2 protein [Flavobacteriales bacterium]|nr:glycosyltransferase family 2 protein [Flavobacteriales bacterium]
MSSAPAVSVIIAARDYGEHLPTALASVSAQTLQDWECIIVDDASSDGTPRIAAEAVAKDKRFRSIRFDANVGVSAARNRGIAEAQGRYVQFLDADDAIAPEKLARQAAFLDAHPDSSARMLRLRAFHRCAGLWRNRASIMVMRSWMGLAMLTSIAC